MEIQGPLGPWKCYLRAVIHHTTTKLVKREENERGADPGETEAERREGIPKGNLRERVLAFRETQAGGSPRPDRHRPNGLMYATTRPSSHAASMRGDSLK
eukprot:scaffold18816_cov32-Tisochrysis_lutea.AAC.5